MSERPILFSAPMVRALLSGAKTQTRRIMKPQPKLIPGWAKFGVGGATDEERNDPDNAGLRLGVGRAKEQTVRVGSLAFYWNQIARDLCPYGAPGDRLWVKETWRTMHRNNHRAPSELHPDRNLVNYVADDIQLEPTVRGKTRVSIHMPRWASRITLEIVGVRVERLQSISEIDADAEGVEAMDGIIDEVELCRVAKEIGGTATDARTWFAVLWNSINRERAPWESNPWVWAIEFRRVAGE